MSKFTERTLLYPFFQKDVQDASLKTITASSSLKREFSNEDTPSSYQNLMGLQEYSGEVHFVSE